MAGSQKRNRDHSEDRKNSSNNKNDPTFIKPPYKKKANGNMAQKNPRLGAIRGQKTKYNPNQCPIVLLNKANMARIIETGEKGLNLQSVETPRTTNIATSYEALNNQISNELTQHTYGYLTNFCKTSLEGKEADIRSQPDYDNFIRPLEIDYLPFETYARELFKKRDLDEESQASILKGIKEVHTKSIKQGDTFYRHLCYKIQKGSEMEPGDIMALELKIKENISLGFARAQGHILPNNLEVATTLLELKREVNNLKAQTGTNRELINHQAAEIAKTQKALTITNLGEADKKIKLTGIDLGSGTNEDKKWRVSQWILSNLDKDQGQLRVLSITTIPTIRGPSYALLTFLTANDARSFENRIKQLRQDVPAMKDVFTNRWNINSSEIIGGDEDTIKHYQESIIGFYNDAIESHHPEFKLEAHHGPLLRIEPKSHVMKGVANIFIEFTDPCDRVSKLAFYQGITPFINHDFTQSIPNPNTREHAKSDKSYEKCTLKDYGLHKVAKKILQ